MHLVVLFVILHFCLGHEQTPGDPNIDKQEECVLNEIKIQLITFYDNPPYNTPFEENQSNYYDDHAESHDNYDKHDESNQSDIVQHQLHIVHHRSRSTFPLKIIPDHIKRSHSDIISI